jgi:hypothetical protein
MREHNSNAIVKAFDSDEMELINEFSTSAETTFMIPDRNWNSLIENYNLDSKRKFIFTPLQCKTIINYVKLSVPPRNVFKAMGVLSPKFNNLVQEASEYEEKFQELLEKEVLTDDERDLFQVLLKNPLRVLMEDVARAEGIAEVMDWEEFERNVKRYPEVQVMKMKARFKEFFNEKEGQGNTTAVQIVLGGDWISSL